MQAGNATGKARRKPRPKSIHLPDGSERHDGLDVMAMAIKRQQKKGAKQIKKLATANS
jgi:hypothetical protein